MAEEKERITEPQGLPEEEFNGLLQSLSTAAPLARSLLPLLGAGEGREDGRHACRNALLCALKPYLSAERAAAVDYLLRIARISDVISNLK
ncbi:MAG: hypothetical protein IKD28_02225 [Clostridia bacterium]|nr:hypothetical protein [Clostridia bacterium]